MLQILYLTLKYISIGIALYMFIYFIYRMKQINDVYKAGYNTPREINKKR